MKKFFLAAVVLTVSIVSSFANPVEKADPKAEQAFNKQFAGAQNIIWSRTDQDVMKVSFVWGGHSTVAYFNSNAEFVGSIRNMFFDQLPMIVIRAVDQKFKSPVVTEVREVSTDEGTTYALAIEEGVKKYTVKFNSLGEVLSKERVKK
ncbi:hypothetical protein LZZ85_26700 [Terrimonas sp. NA20]|uniref:Beta-lactamase-inhibitor-like PepSY-like domain-containing protein n=1 Tax=Terrimonas ginsenosidimutans TaxID=2908004 RepID=A0ABS9L000_9BACT|nr:hypothetical protein [Terrimonas ginsenosidimutans]MCG2617920.1 hypothetical protein [Terrimonas ginsenosidimutans]